jgi:hypothetical protein
LTSEEILGIQEISESLLIVVGYIGGDADGLALHRALSVGTNPGLIDDCPESGSPEE